MEWFDAIIKEDEAALLDILSQASVEI